MCEGEANVIIVEWISGIKESLCRHRYIDNNRAVDVAAKANCQHSQNLGHNSGL